MNSRHSLFTAILTITFGLQAAAADVITLDKLSGPVQVVRDTDGIPHILARTAHDMAMVQGYVMASDRLFQMDLARRQVSGTLAELFGAGVLGDDVEIQTIGLRRAAEVSLLALAPESRDLLQAFAEGVNAFVQQNPLPLEYGLLEVTSFEPWTPVDSVVIAKGLAFSLSFDLDIGNTVTFQTYVAAGAALGFDGQALFFEDMFRAAPFDAASTVPDAPASTAATARSRDAVEEQAQRPAGPVSLSSGRPSVRPEAVDLGRRYLERIERLPMFRDGIQPLERRRGSNEWAVSGAHTESGRPLMANDPHLSLNTPATFYQNHLVARQGGFDVHGSSVPGVPLVVLGQNRHVTWGATTNPADVTDTYLEQLAPSAESPVGLGTVYNGQIEPILAIPLSFRYNVIGDGVLDNLATAAPNSTVGGVFIPPAVLIVPRRNNGPIVSLDLSTLTALSVQYTGFSPTRELDTFRIWNRAQNLDDFINGLKFFDFGSQNWAYADIEGNIAYFTSAEIPVREDLQANTIAGAPPIFIRDGTGGNEWLPVQNPQSGQATPFEILPPLEMPHLVNPDYFVNANNDPAGVTLANQPFLNFRPSGGIYYLNYSYAIGTRAGRITQALEEKLAAGPVSMADMQAIQADVVMLDAQVFTPFIVRAFRNAQTSAIPELKALASDPRVIEAMGRLTHWRHNAPTGVEEGYDASDADGIRLPPDQDEIADSIAATIFSVWRGQMLKSTIDATLGAFGLPAPGSSFSVKALRHLLETFDDNHGVGASGLDFFAGAPLADPENRRDLIILGSLSNALDLLAGPAFDAAFGGSPHQSDYRWGRLHRIVFDHPFGAASPFSTPPAGGAFPPSFPDLLGVATDGGFGVVDASSHSARAAGSDDFMYGGGPVRRYVGEPGQHPHSISGKTSLPGGNSGVLGSPFYANLLPRWLTNETYTMRIRPGEIRGAIAEQTLFRP